MTKPHLMIAWLFLVQAQLVTILTDLLSDSKLEKYRWERSEHFNFRKWQKTNSNYGKIVSPNSWTVSKFNRKVRQYFWMSMKSSLYDFPVHDLQCWKKLLVIVTIFMIVMIRLILDFDSSSIVELSTVEALLATYLEDTAIYCNFHEK